MTAQADYARLIGRELATVRDELLAYPDEAQIWALPPGVPNSAGTLALHIAGNLRWLIGAQLGATGYVRDRDAEFSARGVARATLIDLIEKTTDEVARTFATLPESRLAEPYPIEIAGARFSVSRAIGHLTAHLAYHLGQMDYHRRIVTGMNRSVGAVTPAAVADR